MSVVEQKKETIRAALQELESPSSQLIDYEALRTLNNIWLSHSFEEFDGSIGDFVGDDDFKEEIVSVRVVQVLITVVQDKKAYPPKFYAATCSALFFLCSDNSELATAFVANGGVEFLLETLEAFSSNQPLLCICFVLHKAVIESLGVNGNESEAFAGMTLEKLVDVFELNYETADEQFYKFYCFSVGHSFGTGFDLDLAVKKKCFPRIVSHVWHGVIKHKYDEVAQGIGRRHLRCLVGEEISKKMIDYAEMHHCSEEEYAACA
jgi:hypothetical protein